MALTVRSDAGGTFGAVQFNAEDILRIEATKTKAAPGKLLEATNATNADNAANATLAQTANVALAGPGGSQLGFRNKIINGDMRIYQRNQAAVVSGAYFVDRWLIEASAPPGATFKGDQAADGTVSLAGPYHLYLITQAIGTVAPTHYAQIVQRIEGLNAQDLKFGTAAAKTITLSFRASASQAMTMSVALRNSAANRSYVTTFAIDNVPKNYSVVIPGDTAGTWLIDNGVGLQLSFVHSCGATYQTSTLNAWQAANVLAGPAQGQLFQTLNGYIAITDVQLEIGNVATPFEKRNISVEMLACQRYYEKGGGADTLGWCGVTTNAQAHYSAINFKVQKRASNPIMTYIGSSVTNFPVGNPSPNSVNEFGASLYKSANAAGYGFYFYSYTADAEL